MSDKKAGLFSWWLVLLLLAGIGIAYFFALGPLSTQAPPAPGDSTSAVSSTETYEGQAVTHIDPKAALAERVLGDTSAPVRIAEHSSFSCGHCGNFHRNIFEAFKAAYIDTGKAYLVFSDFPLNAPALHASMLARCLPQDRYFDFVAGLFRDQEQWAYDANYLEILKAKAAENGLNADLFKECINNEEIRNGIISRMQAAGAQWNISSTPSFVVNNKVVVSGGSTIEEFSKNIDDAIAGKAPETENLEATPEVVPPAEDQGVLTPAPAPEAPAEGEASPAPSPEAPLEESTPLPTEQEEVPAADDSQDL
ncbi:MAG: DsbA family protein [Alphaproteobacteria bacterium]|nr:DsbA family protein [Alphaproteobacteria bacterium]